MPRTRSKRKTMKYSKKNRKRLTKKVSRTQKRRTGRRRTQKRRTQAKTRRKVMGGGMGPLDIATIMVAGLLGWGAFKVLKGLKGRFFAQANDTALQPPTELSGALDGPDPRPVQPPTELSGALDGPDPRPDPMLCIQCNVAQRWGPRTPYCGKQCVNKAAHNAQEALTKGRCAYCKVNKIDGSKPYCGKICSVLAAKDNWEHGIPY